MWATATAYVIFYDCINCRVISQLVNELASIELKMKFRQVSGFYIVDDTVINCLPFISQVQKVNSLGKIQFTELYFIFLIYKIFITFTICSQMRKMKCDRRCVQVKTNTAAQWTHTRHQILSRLRQFLFGRQSSVKYRILRAAFCVTLLCEADDHELLTDISTPTHWDQQLTNILLNVVYGGGYEHSGLCGGKEGKKNVINAHPMAHDDTVPQLKFTSFTLILSSTITH